MSAADLAHIALPAGAASGADDWENWNFEYRVVSTADYKVTGTDVTVYATALQLPDGTVDDGTGAAEEAPKVWINNEYGVTATQARELAARLCHLADVVDGWAQ